MNDHTYQVLLIEDNPDDAVLLKRGLADSRADFDVHVAVDLASGLEAVSARSWDVVLSDLSLPDSRGLDTVRKLRSQNVEIPIIVLTGMDSDETALESLDHGAQDYLVKDNVSPEILERAIRYAIQRQKNAAMRRLLDKLQASECALEKKNRRLARLYKTAHRFVDNVSHEFRTPLTVVNEYVSLLRDGIVGGLNDEQKHMLDVIGDRAEDLNNMVDDMLDVSKLEAGMLGMWRKNCRVADIIAHVRPSLARKSTVKEVELQFDIPDDLPEVFTDDEKIGRVIINLTVNAIKFCGRPGRVQVWARHDRDEREVLVGVTDNGDGIGPENLAVIFQRFKQVGGNPRGSTKGFGLGLAIAKELVHLNLGEIRVKSSVGHGSTFWFSLPIADPIEVMSRFVDRIAHLPNGRSTVSVVMAAPGAPIGDDLADDLNTFLDTIPRRHDLILRIDQSSWLLALPCEEFELPRLIQRTEELRETINRNRPKEPLPRVAFETLGTWLIPDDVDGIMNAVAGVFRPQPLARC